MTNPKKQTYAIDGAISEDAPEYGVKHWRTDLFLAKDDAEAVTKAQQVRVRDKLTGGKLEKYIPATTAKAARFEPVEVPQVQK